jgi:hypothetical protein
MRVASFLLVMCGCGAVEVGPDAAPPSLRVIWSPETCDGDGRLRIQVRLEDRDGVVEVAEAPCGEGSMEAVVGHVGWYVASALVLEAGDRGVAIATSTLAIDGPAVTWRLPW